jgi:hypothetical protein
LDRALKLAPEVQQLKTRSLDFPKMPSSSGAGKT